MLAKVLLTKTKNGLLHVFWNPGKYAVTDEKIKFPIGLKIFDSLADQFNIVQPRGGNELLPLFNLHPRCIDPDKSGFRIFLSQRYQITAAGTSEFQDSKRGR